MKVYAIVAASATDNVIGLNGSIPWDEPEDRKFFRRRTSGSTLIMGRKTFESLGNGKLPNREIVVVTRQKDYDPKYAEVAHTPREALDIAKEYGKDIYVAGGAEIYEQLMDCVSEIYWTVIPGEYRGDAFLESPGPEWEQVSRVPLKEGVENTPFVLHFCRVS